MSSAAREPTAYEKRVHDAVRRIPEGKVTSYGAVAKRVGGAARAVGGAMRRNPYLPSEVAAELAVNWHRVVGSDRRLTGFSGQTKGEQLDRKRKLLEDEGVAFDHDGKVSKRSFLADLGEEDDGEDDDAPADADADAGPADDDELGLREATLALVKERGPDKTCWPSEVPRSLYDDWKHLMPQMHALAKRLAREGRLDVLQRGSVVADLDHIRGPYRLRIHQ